MNNNEQHRWDSILKWIKDPNRKPAQYVFTDSPMRQIAYEFEVILKE